LQTVSLSFSYPTPPPPSIFRIIMLARNSPQNRHNKGLRGQNPDSTGLTGQFLAGSVLVENCWVYCLCRDNDGTNRGLCARSDVTRRLWISLGDRFGRRSKAKRQAVRTWNAHLFRGTEKGGQSRLSPDYQSVEVRGAHSSKIATSGASSSVVIYEKTTSGPAVIFQ
jgi:hypothetical protein